MQASQRHVIEVSENIWKVTSQHQDDVIYTVHHLLTSCECKLSCKSWNVCVHQYTCSCLDATIHATVCKHIHLIHMRSSNTLTKTARNQDSLITKTKRRSISLIQPYHSILSPNAMCNKNCTNFRLLLRNALIQMLLMSCQTPPKCNNSSKGTPTKCSSETNFTD